MRWLTGIFVFALHSHLLCQIVTDAEDPNGVAMPYARVRLVHSSDLNSRGATADLRSRDPYLFYQLGRDLVHRQYTIREGLYGRSGELSVPLYVGRDRANVPARFARDHAGSCDSCHSNPPREPGSGQTIASTGPMGRNSPHFYGAGLVEMIAEQIRLEILERFDRNRNGRIEPEEAPCPSPVRIAPQPGAPPIDFGDACPGPDGVPKLNVLFRIWYVDSRGHVLPDALSLRSPGVAGYNFAPQPFGWGRGTRLHSGGERTSEGAEASTLRAIFTLAADLHMGLEAHDPSQRNRESGELSGFGGLASISLNGAQQFAFDTAPDAGTSQTALGVSLDDSDGDGVIEELSEGDVDAAEFYMLNAPAPAVRRTATSESGRPLLIRIGCTRCHVEDWRIRARGESPGWTGDRRFFDFQTTTETLADGSTRLRGRLVSLTMRGADGRFSPRGDAFDVRRIYTDLKHWDIGPAYYERRHDGSLQREHRTAPLWGAGSTAPYGHSGQFATLDEAILAHGGQAEPERRRYVRLSAADRKRVIEYLESLVLFPTNEIPADIDGDGVASENFFVAGRQVGYERFEPRFLFKTPPQYDGPRWIQAPNGMEVPLMQMINIDAAFGLDLPWRRDSLGMGMPDVLRDRAPRPQGSRQ
jgi:hypothetical protein